MTPALEILGPEHANWKGWPAGAKTLFESIFAEQVQLWRTAGSPRPAPNRVMEPIDKVMFAAWQTDLAKELEAADPHILVSLGSELRGYQHHLSMISTQDLVAAL